MPIRLGVTLACSLLLAPTVSALHPFTYTEPTALLFQFMQEAIIGYLLGFIFSLLFEAAAFAGQLIGALMGFSATELLDPLSTSQHPLMARFFSLVMFTLFLALDLHHPLLRFLYSSFEAVPLTRYPFTLETIIPLIQASASLFQHALSWALFPLITLLSLIALFAFLSRFFPIFWVGFPLQLFVGFASLAASAVFLAPLLEQAYFQLWTLIKNSIVNY